MRAGALLALAMLALVRDAAALERRSIVGDAVERQFWLLRPPSRAPVPLVVLLQGALQDPLSFASSTGLPALAEREGLAVAIPETVQGHWNDGRQTVYFGAPSMAEDAGFLDRMLETLVTEGTARADAVYLAGFSNGGLMALTLACRPGRVPAAGLLVVAATLGTSVAADCRPPAPLTVVLVNGTADPLFPYAGGTGLVNGRSGEPMLAATETAAFFARSNGCGKRGRLAASGEAMGQGHAITVDGYVGCPDAGQVVQVTVTGGGHEWPPGSVDALGEAAGASGPASLAELAWAVFRGRSSP